MAEGNPIRAPSAISISPATLTYTPEVNIFCEKDDGRSGTVGNHLKT
jgi:hypothetical protein